MFEYKTIILTQKVSFWGGKYEEEDVTTVLNEQAKEGWEYVNCTPLARGYGECGHLMIVFKRVKNEGEIVS